MWVFIFLYILSLNSQASATENSTQMYYAKLIIDRSAIEIISSNLSFYVKDNNVTIDNVRMTTKCDKNNGSKTCRCEHGHKWSDEVLLKEGCDGNNCTLKADSNSMCTLNTTVDITGRFKLGGDNYTDCLTDKASSKYMTCHARLLNQMKTLYSKIRGFDSLAIIQFSLGSIIVDFTMKIVSDVSSGELFNKSTELTKTLTGSMTLETKGIVNLEVSKASVPYDNKTVVTCKTERELKAQPQWNLNREDGSFLITNGSISTVEIKEKESSVTIQHVNELWQGEYVCLFVEKEGQITINHKANDTMDVCLKPKIDISADPAFPLCKTEEDSVLYVIVKCEIKNTTEKYNVSWQEGAIVLPTTTDKDKLIYSAKIIVDCKKDKGNSSPDSYCDFTNECNQVQKASMTVEVIYLQNQYCSAEGEWGNTKAEFTAEIKCKDKAGTRKRKCSPGGIGREGIWGDEVSQCVEQDLANVLESATISDIGLGILATNAAIVFERFVNVTKTSKLPGYANINTSVAVLSTMDKKLNNSVITNETAIENFLFSSSHLLNKSLEDSWNKDTTDNTSMAEKFMLSVENLIKISNMTGGTKKENLHVDVCNSSNCNITVFNVSVVLSGGVNVKTAAFKQLDKYLPNLDNKTEVNSIIVSTTADSYSDITLKFEMIKPRPRNVELKCVFWDNKKHAFSSDGCRWLGPSKEGHCTCDHLSSFALLLSKEPLDVPGLTYLTYAALSVSVLSLIVTLVIELIVWSDVVKTSTLYLRHTAHVNICLCLLIGNLCFLASSSNPENISDLWCRTSAVLKHFCYLAMFFWTFCLSATLLHQAVFLFHKVSKANYLRFSLVVGYAIPLIIVFVTFLTCNGGAEGVYYLEKTCWLVYGGLFKGTFYTFIIPVGAIVFINVFSMLVVIMKLISHHSEIHQKTDISPEKEKAAAKTVVRSIILLTPIFGVTWIFGFAILIFDLTSGPAAYAFEYIFTVLNGFQGFFILLTTCFLDRMTREALLKHIKKKAPASSVSESTSKSESTWKK
ncbi:adhesion G protein-coupled receptor F5 isoform X2 [Xiphophorus hellerii]|uniref:adhesion G protein-coupled receptor F5 isoform X2 n=1 Tax=Xiphophorus hellerii TaxID=8084 RepID=UPI0013B3D339|nr:adhesion G protein-coupled receptor F5-like isoform X2 [Xiphophorus hellerii]